MRFADLRRGLSFEDENRLGETLEELLDTDEDIGALLMADELDELIAQVRKQRRPREPLHVTAHREWEAERARLDEAILIGLQNVGDEALGDPEWPAEYPAAVADNVQFVAFLGFVTEDLLEDN
jgi:hypothetical protein